MFLKQIKNTEQLVQKYPDLEYLGKMDEFIKGSPYRTQVFYSPCDEVFIFWGDQGNTWGIIEGVVANYLIRSMLGLEHPLVKKAN